MKINNINNEGFLLIDKISGITSFKTVFQIKKILNLKKIGHAGTLDSNATGLLLVSVGRSTKLLKYFFGSSKKYLASICFGEQRNTDDIEGKVVCKSDKSVDFSIVEEQLKKFKGQIKQIPPDFSSIHINGVRAYKTALKNQKPVIKERTVTIYDYNIIDFTDPVLKIEFSCSSGTYIRAIARDLGINTGYYAYLSDLRRLNVLDFDIKDAYSVENIENNNFTFIDPFTALSQFASIEIKDEFTHKIQNGCKFELHWLKDHAENEISNEGFYRIHNNKKLLAVIKFNNGNFIYDLVY